MSKQSFLAKISPLNSRKIVYNHNFLAPVCTKKKFKKSLKYNMIFHLIIFCTNH